MIAAWTPRHLRRLGLATALLAALPVAPSSAAGWPLAAWLASLALFLLLFWSTAGEACASWAPAKRSAALVAMIVVALALVALGDGTLAAAYPVLVAALAGSLLTARPALYLVVVQSLFLFIAFAASGLAGGDAALLALVFGGLQLFVVHTAQVARAESAARLELEETHGRLQAAQERLAATSRDAERVRIARDLHDVMGHHLTALSLTLEAASHAPSAARDEHVAQALVLTKRLLRDVRQVVSTLREATPDLLDGLRQLAAEARRPRVLLTLGDSLPETSGAHAQALLRCAQEAVTNAARHGDAEHLWLDLSVLDAGLLLSARDDGRTGPGAVDAGHGLRGVEERVGELGGRVRWERTEAGGFALEAWLPAAGARR